VRGYIRPDPAGPQAAPPDEAPEATNAPVLTAINPAADSLSQQLEKITGMALLQAEEILSKPLEGADGNLMRAKTSIVSATLNTQVRADENLLRAKRDSGVLDRFAKLLRQVRKEVPREPKAKPIKAIEESAGA
jgi:hypothetical protein